ncbi:MAG: lytic murein transglycosylase [Proteobacteria bacterium]|nr:lytic murein transglycosylase [Pseudomonadota bacterium]
MRNLKGLLRNAFLCVCLLAPELAGARPASPPAAATGTRTAAAQSLSTKTKAEKHFSTWLQELKAEAAEKGISQKVIQEALPDTLKPISRVLELDHKQPERKKTLAEYLNYAVSPGRVSKGIQKIDSCRALLQAVGDHYRVEPEVIVALWGAESGYGRTTGDFNVVSALVTLAYDGRRSEFFRGEVFKALEILEQEHMPASSLKGSWAGAIGQCQFMPSSYFRYAVDFDRDGRHDIWGTRADVFASTANYLAKNGWQRGEPCLRRVELPVSFDRTRLGLDQGCSLQFWNDQGLKLSDGGFLPPETSSDVSVIQPDGPGTPAYAVYHNFRVIMSWNKSVNFAASIGLLSGKLKGPAQ